MSIALFASYFVTLLLKRIFADASDILISACNCLADIGIGRKVPSTATGLFLKSI
jgi:hypothetical protein